MKHTLLNQIILGTLLILIAACGGSDSTSPSKDNPAPSDSPSTNVSNIQFLGSAFREEKGVRSCVDYSAKGLDEAQTTAVKDLVRTSSKNDGMTYSDSRCDTRGAIGRCNLDSTLDNITMSADIYFYGNNVEAAAKAACSQGNGRYSAL